MRINTAKQKMLKGQPAFGYGLGLGSPVAAEALAHCGIDFLLLDRQHGSWGEDSTIAALIAMHGGSAIPMARVSRNDYTMIGRLLDEGCMGIIVPMVHTAEDAKAAADACRLPPTGSRSWGWGRAALYGSDYPDTVNDQIFVAVQIESRLAVENVEAIMATPGIDIGWIGHFDLTNALGIDGQFDHPRYKAAVKAVVKACKRNGKAAGFLCGDVKTGKRYLDWGFRVLAYGTDTGVFQGALKAGIDGLRERKG